MRVWLIRAVVVTFVASGIIVLALFFCTRVLERGPIANRLERDAVRELTLAGELLVQIYRHGEGQLYEHAGVFGDVGGEDGTYMLFDHDLQLLVGNPANTTLLELARKARDVEGLAGRVPQPIRDVGARLERAMPYTARDGSRYYIAESIISKTPLPQLDTYLWIGVRVLAVVLAAFILYLLIRMNDRPAREMRRVLHRFARGDLAARIKLDEISRYDELAKLAREFNAMAEHMCRLYSEQQRLFGELSHEMRSPLSRMSLAVELARRSEAAEKDRLLLRIRRDAERLGMLTNEMMELSRFRTIRDAAQTIDMAGLVGKVVADSRFEAQARNISIRNESDPAPMLLTGTADPLYRMLENVVRNAIRHSPDGGEIVVSLQRIPRLGQAVACIRVSDQGPGVPEEEIVQIFKPFVRGSSSAGTEGKGLGLAITRHVVHRHGGQVRAENIQNGFVVIITLPLGEIAAPVQKTAEQDFQTVSARA